MTALLLAGWLCSHAWAWDVVPGATSYRVYWANRAAGPWLACNVVEVPASACDATTCQWNPPMPHADFYFVPVAVNANGEGPWPVNVPRQECAP